MSDLDAFFSKKDKKNVKNKAAAGGGGGGGGASGGRGYRGWSGMYDSSAGGGGGGDRGGAEQGKVQGWVDFEEARTAQVHTGGKTIVELRRDEASGRNGAGDNNAGEGFAGWKVETTTEEQQGKARDYPSLADAAKTSKLTPKQQSSQKKQQPQRPVRRPLALRQLMENHVGIDTGASRDATPGETPSTSAPDSKPGEPGPGPTNRFESLGRVAPGEESKDAGGK